MKNTAILIDTNLVLDWTMKRQPFHQDATEIIGLCMSGKLRGYLAAHTVLNVFYITRKDFGVEERNNFSRLLCNRFTIIGIGREQMLAALDGDGFKDLEDSLQMECAYEKNVDYIITRDVSDFKNSRITTMLPKEFLALWRTSTH